MCPVTAEFGANPHEHLCGSLDVSFGSLFASQQDGRDAERG